MRTLRYFTFYFFLLTVNLGMNAIPNYGMFTDGWRIYDVRGRFHSRLSLFSFTSSSEDKGSYFSLTCIDRDVFLVDSLESQELILPPLVHPKDTVLSPIGGELGLFFVNSSGRLYASMRHTRSYISPEKVRRCDSLSILYGTYHFARDEEMSFTFDQEDEPQLIVRSGTEGERVSFCTDVVYNGRPLIHIKTSRRRWLIELTPAGMNVYSAIWDKTRRQYVRGSLLRRAKLVCSRALLFEESNQFIPLVDILYRFYTKAICRDILTEMETRKNNLYNEVYIDLFRRLEAGMTR